MLVKGLGSLLVLAVGTFLLGMAEFVIEGILPDLARDLNISIPMAGHAISIYALGVCVGATFLIVLHKLRPKHILLGLVSLVFIGALLSVTAQSYVWLLAARFISGLPHGAYYGVGTIVAYRLADESHKTRAVAIMCAGMTFANLLGNPVATLLSGALSWRLAFAVIAVGSLVDLLLVARFVPNLDPLPGSGYKGQFRFLRHLDPWLIILATMFGNGGILAWYSYISPALVDEGGLSASLLPLYMAVAGLGMVIGNLLSGWMSDKYKAGLTAMVLQGVAGLALLTVFFTVEWGLVHLALMFVCSGCLFGMGTPEQLLIIEHSKGGEMLGGCCIQIAFNFGNAAGAFLGGLPISWGMGYAWPAMVGMPFVAIGFLLLLAFHRRYE
ncbi:MFS transporter [Hallella faecis]|uniref:MFS transporter n=1 Tax=Hallella faecis TaxID=2841596 RepID=A0ABV1FN76_9BACT|nr:MFS transporter [Hallella faecis]MBU0288991.1 MFS transporter [Hallella faecis]